MESPSQSNVNLAMAVCYWPFPRYSAPIGLWMCQTTTSVPIAPCQPISPLNNNAKPLCGNNSHLVIWALNGRGSYHVTTGHVSHAGAGTAGHWAPQGTGPTGPCHIYGFLSARFRPSSEHNHRSMQHQLNHPANHHPTYRDSL